MLGKIEGERRRGWQRMRWLDSITHSLHMSLSSELGGVRRPPWVADLRAGTWTWEPGGQGAGGGESSHIQSPRRAAVA